MSAQRKQYITSRLDIVINALREIANIPEEQRESENRWATLFKIANPKDLVFALNNVKYKIQDSNVICAQCDDTVIAECTECEGKGQIRCDICDDGWHVCVDCDNEHECARCEGTGFKVCDYCENGLYTCPCEGDDKVVFMQNAT